MDEANEADRDTVQQRMDAIPVTDLVTQLSQIEQDHTVNRQLLCDHYKGAVSVRTYFSMSRPGSALGSECAILAANRIMNPCILTQPGKNGLMFDADIAQTEVPDLPATPYAKREDEDDSKDEDKPDVIPSSSVDTKPRDLKYADRWKAFGFKLVFLKLSECHWRYLGRYDQYPLKQLTVAEWNRQSEAVSLFFVFVLQSCQSMLNSHQFKNLWASRVLDGGVGAAPMKEQVLRWTRLRRRLHRDPTKDELRAEIALLSTGNESLLKKEDILAAFEHGILVSFLFVVRLWTCADSHITDHLTVYSRQSTDI